MDPSPEVDKISSLATRSGAHLLAVPMRRLDAEARTRSHQGVLALAAPLEESLLEDLYDTAEHKDQRLPFVLVLDGVTDPQNLGALLRTAECAGVTGIVLARHSSAHITPTVAKVSAGAIEYLKFAVAPGIPTAIARLTEMGMYCIGLDPTATEQFYELNLGPETTENGVALVLGDEGKGLGALTRKRCSALASIPQYGAIGSLNVAAAGAVACFELARTMNRTGANDPRSAAEKRQ